MAPLASALLEDRGIPQKMAFFASQVHHLWLSKSGRMEEGEGERRERRRR